jgi:HEAT repeat protein
MLARFARDPREGVRAAAMRSLAQRAGVTAWRELGDGLRDDAAWVRYYAVQGLGRLGDVAAIGLVIDRLADSAAHVRVAAIEALGHLDGPVAWQALCSLILSADLDERRAALASMAMREHALPYLLDAAAAADVATRLIALSGLARRAEPAALAALAAAAVGEPSVCDAALSLLGDREDAPAAAALVELCLGASLQHPAQRTLSRPGIARSAAIAARLPFVDDAGAARLIGALARLRDTPAVKAALALDNAAVRRAAARALIALGDVALLARLAVDDPDLEVREISASAP